MMRIDKTLLCCSLTLGCAVSIAFAADTMSSDPQVEVAAAEESAETNSKTDETATVETAISIPERSPELADNTEEAETKGDEHGLDESDSNTPNAAERIKQDKANDTHKAQPGPKVISGMSILGNQEAPKSLTIVPWKSSVLGDSMGIKTILDDSKSPVDRDVFMRVLSYYEIRFEEVP